MKFMGSWLMVGTVVLMLAVACGCEPTVKKSEYDRALSAAQQDTLTAQNEAAALRTTNDDLSTRLTSKEKEGTLEALREAVGSDAEVKMIGGRPSVVMGTDLVFASGKATLTPQGEATLKRLANLIKTKYPMAEVAVVGHTDNQPIVKTKNLYKSNWELSSTRALNVVHFLVEKGDLDPNRVHGEAYGEHRPVAPNSGKNGAKGNRRVEIMLLGIK
jgi:chemotaxis protein MotB